MAPRTTVAELFSLPFTSTEGVIMKPVFDTTSADSVSSFIFSTPVKLAKQLTAQSASQRLLHLMARHRAAEKRTSHLLSLLHRLSQNSIAQPCAFDSDKTESSSNDEEEVIPQQRQSKLSQIQQKSKSTDAWYQSRATIRSHWSLLQTEMVRTTDCLNTLKPLRHLYKKWRKSIPALIQSVGLIESTSTDQPSSRTMPYQKTEKPRHSYYDLSAISELDFKFLGRHILSYNGF